MWKPKMDAVRLNKELKHSGSGHPRPDRAIQATIFDRENMSNHKPVRCQKYIRTGKGENLSLWLQQGHTVTNIESISMRYSDKK
jgi:hypothetical protein